MNPRFNFVVPVIPRVAARSNWEAKDNPDGRSVEAALNRSVTAMCNSTVPVIVHLIAHELPKLTINLEHDVVEAADGWKDKFVGDRPLVVIHRVGFSTPDKIKLDEYNKLSGKILPELPDYVRRRVGDKYSKIKVGVGAVLDDDAGQFLMLMDHDDLIHRDVAAFAFENNGKYEGGHTVTTGYSWIVGRKNFAEVKRFFQVCGSCNLVRIADWEREQWKETGDVNTFDRKTHWLYAGHTSVHGRLRKQGRDTAKIPFHGSVYVTDTGANISGARSAGKGHFPLTDELQEQFGLHLSGLK